MSDYWEGVGTDAALPDFASAEVTEGVPACENQDVGWACTRAAGHSGRHMAGTGRAVVAAWPGTGRPTPSEVNAL